MLNNKYQYVAATPVNPDLHLSRGDKFIKSKNWKTWFHKNKFTTSVLLYSFKHTPHKQLFE